MKQHVGRLSTRQRPVMGAALVAASLLTLAGCATANATAAQGPPSVSARANGNPPPPTASASPTTYSRLPDPIAPALVKAKRGVAPAPKPTIDAAPASFNKPVSYGDGVVVRVEHITQSTEAGSGPGVFPGRPNTTISLQLKNGTSRALNLTQVVVTVQYGEPARLAPAVYNGPAAMDFSGTLAAGATASATYIFSVPPSALDHVVLSVDFDAIHGSALFKGAAK